MQGCLSLNGKKVPHGETFVPGPDYCTMCKCDDGRAHICRSVLCQSPQDCKYFRIGETCCDFICLDDMLPPVHKDDKNKGTHFDLTLRTLGSAITTILSLALLLFLIYRLRQRRRKDAQRQCFEDSLELEATSGLPSDSCHSNPCCHSSIYGSGNDPNDLFVSINSPTSLWKPPYFFQYREPPPSYNEAVRNDGSVQTPISESNFNIFHSLRSPAVHVTASSGSETSTESSSDSHLYATHSASIAPESTLSSPENRADVSLTCATPNDQNNDTILSDQVYEEANICANAASPNGLNGGDASASQFLNELRNKTFRILSLRSITENSQNVYYLEQNDQGTTSQSEL